jgi:hypothetical protein
MYGLGVNRLGVTNVSSSGFNPLSLFANGEQGAWYDPSDLSSMKQLSDGTVDAVVDQPVGYIEDKSGNNSTAIQATSNKRPTLRQSGSLYYLEFEGAQGLRTANTIDFSGTDSMSVFAGARKNTDATANVAELSNNSGGNEGSFRLSAIVGDQWRYASRGDSTGLINTNANNYVAPVTNVLTGLSDISDPFVIIRVDGVQKNSSTTSQGAGNYGNYPLNVGARNNGGGFQLDGHIYSLIIRGASSSADEIASTEAYVAAETGVSL